MMFEYNTEGYVCEKSEEVNGHRVLESCPQQLLMERVTNDLIYDGVASLSTPPLQKVFSDLEEWLHQQNSEHARAYDFFVANVIERIGRERFSSFPVKDLGKRCGATDYIDFLTPADVDSSVMVGVDVYHRPFVTLRLTSKLAPEVLSDDEDRLRSRRILDAQSRFMITFFQRYTDGTRWTFGTNADMYLLGDNFYHGSPNDVQLQTLIDIVNGCHSVLSLA